MTETREGLLESWKAHDTEEERKDAINLLDKRLNHRGRSHNGLLVLMGVMGAGEINLLSYSVATGLLVMKSTTFGLGALLLSGALLSLLWAIVPAFKELFPNWTEDEGVDALKKSRRRQGEGADNCPRFGEFYELTSRSNHQRQMLWHERVWFTFSVILTMITLLLEDMPIIHLI